MTQLAQPLPIVAPSVVTADDEVARRERFAFGRNRPLFLRIIDLRLWTANNDHRLHRWRDMVDWVGGNPYEVAPPDAAFGFCRDRRFGLMNLRCVGVGLGCDEFLFERV